MSVVDRGTPGRWLLRIAAASFPLAAACDPGEPLAVGVGDAPAQAPEHSGPQPAPASTPHPESLPDRALPRAAQPLPVPLRLRASVAALDGWLTAARPALQQLVGTDLVIDPDTEPGAIAATTTGLVPAALVLGAAPGSAPSGLALGRLPVAVVTHPDNPLRNLARRDLELLLTGAIADWRQLGVSLGPVTLLALRSEHPLQEACERAVAVTVRLPRAARRSPGHDALVAQLRREPGALALLPLGVATNLGLQPLQVDGAAPRSGADPGRYPLYLELVLHLQSTPAAPLEQFLQRLRSPAGQELRARTLAL